MTKDTYLNGKRKWGSITAAVLLSAIQLYAFMTGLQIGESGFLIGATLWFTLFLIQTVGNDFAKEDGIFFAGWVFSYLLEICAGTWAFYTLLEIPETDEMMVVVRWGFAIGLSGVVALLPERLLILALTPAKRKVVEPFKPAMAQPATPAKKAGSVFSKFTGGSTKKFDPIEPRKPAERSRLDFDRE
jgi:hypothetical protein